ncbi:peptide chain release factor 1 [Porphyromonas crevioricanis JCM 15906]|uniref:Peptide chain release factor 1 n=2 Tax=Porphyromonas crevioricanis TaxID=393921 RepID=A0A2X4PEY4_9PORP|nr:peptide chain release factor 1 [Porphyromonas crevioricanis]KGN96964.1 peptide chain release factor 1 [Porphyromonas crevioricanis]SJZ99652.1 peptide chain release factor 1 [Porphyromonas crevioricanis]SQH72456.1 Peptide chain release factor 1 [Porphyromonas crevioricanis]GAD05204.1 peptide chain release factor 1 [Porphyromonas crevioricanis JCM 15906]GAD06462.1 peptide chain release factor 1 [Porphyromonas crevioricanis JCM 13913]
MSGQVTNDITKRLDELALRLQEVSTLIADPEVIADGKRFVALGKEYSELERIASVGSRYKQLLADKEEAEETLATESDEELRQIAKIQLDEAIEAIPSTEEEIKLLLIPGDPEDDKDAIMEIRGGIGGDEAALFAGELYRMYTKYAEQQGWRVEVTDYSEGTTGGYKEIVFTVSGSGAYGILKYESGVHRVQRVPQTETQGRIHTSAATVAVLPQADEFDVELKESDIRVDIFCASGPGGQSVNTTYSAIRLVHIPTGITVQCQDQKSQLKNKAKAMVELRSRIYNMEHQKYLDEVAAKRKTMVSTGDRSAKIRTYNFPQGRITDHRINFTTHNLHAVLDGDLQPILDQLIMAENFERLKEVSLQ